MPTMRLSRSSTGKTTNLVFLHDPLGFLDVLILEAVDDLPSHSFFHGCGLWISPVRDNSNCNIAVSEYSHKAVSVAHRKNTHIKRAHLPSGFLSRRLQCDDFHIFCHDTIKLHGRYGSALRRSIQCSHPVYFFDMNTKANHLIIASGWEGLGLQRSGFSFVFRNRRTSPARFVKYEVLVCTDCDLARIDRGWSQRARRAVQAARNAIWTVVEKLENAGSVYNPAHRS